jgi:hypothetical protein
MAIFDMEYDGFSGYPLIHLGSDFISQLETTAGHQDGLPASKSLN